MSLTIDASVFVASLPIPDVNHVASREFIERVRQQRIAVVCPTLLLAEIAGALARRTGDDLPARHACERILRWRGMQLLPLTRARAVSAAAVAAQHGLRGADSTYLAAALERGCTVVTWDREMLERGTALVATTTPGDWLSANPAP